MLAGLTHCQSPCGPGEFECTYPADGCIRQERVADGTTDCLRDGSDESVEAKRDLAKNIFPNGKSNKFPTSSHCKSIYEFLLL